MRQKTFHNSENEFLKQQLHIEHNTPARGRNGFDRSFYLPRGVLMAAEVGLRSRARKERETIRACHENHVSANGDDLS
jgi:hypothetical protein